jgi:hypothetical protein
MNITPAADRHYQANFTKGGLMVPESRVVADLLLQGVDAAGWKQAIGVENRLRKRSPTTAATLALLISARLRTMTADLWLLVRDGGKPVATQAVLAATLKYSPLLGDFLDLVVRDLYRRFEPCLQPWHWYLYLEDCRLRDPAMPQWTPATLDKLRTRAFHMLAEAGYLRDDRSRQLLPPPLAPEVMAYLQGANEDYVHRCLSLAP